MLIQESVQFFLLLLKYIGNIAAVKNVKVRIYKTIILLVVLYGCETWSLAVREEHKLRVFENGVLRRKVVVVQSV
jgi:hypothetical protein